MRHATTMMIAACGLLGLTVSIGAAASPAVVLELFTSNSCSSCPPAYRMLSGLRVDGDSGPIQLIRLDQHVDYWNQLSWVDRYSDAQFTERQQEYARDVFGPEKVYTPQLVVNGRREMIGSDEASARRAIQAAAAEQALPVNLTVTDRDSRQVQVNIKVGGKGATVPSRIWVALTQNEVVSRVGAGENSGRTLREDGVVRELRPVARLDASAAADPAGYSAQLALPTGVDVADLHAVAFIRRADNQAIIGATSENIERSGVAMD